MSAPFSTPGYPNAPKPTPSSLTSSTAALKAPIYNPYDKFTQPEFDAWIGDITGALKRALGREDEPPAKEPVPQTEDAQATDVSAYGDVDDSFAEIKARRALKGKERAREEDLAEDEDEETVEVVVISSDEEDSNDDSNGEEYLEEAEGEVDDGASDDERDPFGPEVVDDVSDDEDGSPVMVAVADETGLDEEYEEEVAEGREEGAVDREDIEDVEDEDVDDYDPGSSPPQAIHDIFEVEDEDEDELAQDEELDERTAERPVELPGSWEGPNTYAEDFYSAGDLRLDAAIEGSAHLLPTEADTSHVLEIIGDDEDEDEAFLPRVEVAGPVDIVDPWNAPQTYAEDLYTGGEILGDTSLLTPSHLTPVMSTPEEEDIGMVITPEVLLTPNEVDELQSSDNASSAENIQVDELRVNEDNQNQGSLLPLPDSSLQDREFDPSELEDLYAELDKDLPVSSVQASTDDLASELLASENASSVLMVVEQFPEPHTLRERSSSPPRISDKGHVDWTWPPAFPGKLATVAEQVKLPEEAKGKGKGEEEAAIVSEISHEILEISDDEEEQSPLPLAASDLLHVDVSEGDADDEIKEAYQGNQAEGLYGESAFHEQSDSIMSTEETLPRSLTHEQQTSVNVRPESHTTPDLPNYNDAKVEQPQSTVPQEDVGFGDLPPTPMGTEEPGVTGEDVLNILSTLGDTYDATFPDPGVDSIGEPLVQAVFADFADVEEVPPPTVGQTSTEAVKEGGEVHGTFSMPLTTEGEEYFVTEAVTDDEHVEESEIDVVTDYGELPVASLEYTVEEIITDGRRTEEPEIVPPKESEPEPPTELNIPIDSETNIFRSSRSKTPDAQSALRDITSYSTGLSIVVAEVESDDETPHRRRARLLHSRSKSTATSEGAVSTTPSPAKPVTANVIGRRPEPASSMDPSQTVHIDDSHHPSLSETVLISESESVNSAKAISRMDRHLESGVPVPVSADPAVPDPASVWGTPRAISPQLEASVWSRNAPHADELERAAETGSLLRASLKQPLIHNLSGLFTPGTGSDSSPASPAVAAEAAPATEGCREAEVDEHSANAPIGIPALDQSTDPAQSSMSEDMQSGNSGTAVETTDSDNLDSLDVHDVDADGDLDPEYHGEEIALLDESTSQSTVVATADEADTSPSANSDGKVAPEVVEGQSSVPTEQDETAIEPSGLIAPAEEPAQDEAPLTRDQTKDEVLVTATLEDTKDELHLAPEDAKDPGQANGTKPILDDGDRPLKRKRMSPPPAPPRLTRSKSAMQKSEVEPSAKWKGKAVDHDIPEDDNDTDSIASSRDGGFTRPSSKGKRAVSRASSRASSVASTRTSASALSESSAARVRNSNATTSTLQPSFVHAGGVLHHHHGRPPAQQRAPAPPKNADRPLIHPETSQTHHPSLSYVPPSYSSSPVTRSNCRFHKISIPLDEDAPRVFFVVPGCSLTNTELMEEEEIEDHGDATLADNARLVPDVEALDFSSYLIGVMRQLVGVDLLREQEIFYLPQEGEHIGLKPKQPSKIKPRSSMASATAGPTSPRVSKGQMRSPAKKVPSRAGSVSTVSSVGRGSQSQVGSASVAGSISGNEHSDAEDAPRTKRRKSDKRKAVDDNLSFRARRSKRLSADAAAYKPVDSDGSSDEDQPRKSRGKKGQRGVKRSRNAEGQQDDNDEGKSQTKRRKVHASSPVDAAEPSAD